MLKTLKLTSVQVEWLANFIRNPRTDCESDDDGDIRADIYTMCTTPNFNKASDFVEEVKAYRAETGCGMEAAKKHVRGIHEVVKNDELKEKLLMNIDDSVDLQDFAKILKELVENVL